MAGRKNHMQQAGMMGQDLSHIKDPLERDFAFRSIQVEVHCKHCGAQVVYSHQDKDGRVIDAEWEQKNMAHYSCHSEWKKEMEYKAMVELRNKAEESARFDWDAYMKDMLDKKED